MAVWSAVNITDTFTANRLDAEFFQPKFLDADNALRRCNAVSLQSLLSDVRYGLNVPPDYVERGLPFLRALNLKEYGIAGEILTIPFTPEQVGQINILRTGDLLIVRSGANVGDTGVVTSRFDGHTFGSYVIKLQLKNVDPFYAYVFLKCRFGRSQTVRFRSGSAQPNISIPNLEQILVYVPSPQSQAAVRRLFVKFEAALVSAQERSTDAESILTSALGLDKIDLSPALFYERPFGDLLASRRFDAEHFQPKYETLLGAIRKHDAVRLGSAVRQTIRRGISPTYFEDGDLLVINSQHIGKTAIALEDNRTTRKALIDLKSEDNRTGVVRRGDVLLNSTGRITIGRCQCLLDDVVAVVDNHVAIIRPTADLDPVYLAFFLNSLPGLMQTERGYTGSSGQIELRPDVIEDYLVWKAPRSIQTAIRQQLEGAHAVNQGAHRLLEEAKTEVERLILEAAKE